MTRALVITGLAVAALAGCGGSRDGGIQNKAGGSAPARPRTIEIQASDAASPEAQYFAKQIRAHSGGTLTAKILQDYPSRTPSNEARLARDLMAGKADFGVLPARGWAPAGVKAFDALQAPFVIGSYDVARAAMAGPAGNALEAALEKAGVTPLGLVPAELRRVLSVRPLATPDAFRGMSIRIPDNGTSAATLRSLGATPVQGMSSDAARLQLHRHRLAGAETAPVFAISTGYGAIVKQITGYALFDRVDTLVASPAAWKRLSAGQRAAVAAAARDAVALATTLPERDEASLVQLCRSGVRVTAPTEGQLAALAAATEPVRDELRADASAGPVLRALEATPGAGPQVLPPPRGCTEPRPATTGTTAAPLPNGTYKVRDSVVDFERWGQYGDEWEKPITSTFELTDGRWRHWEKPAYGVGVVGGTYRVKGDQVTFTWVPENEIPPFTMRWSYYMGQLTWEPVDVTDLGLKIIFAAHPWKKVG